jgi:signal peptidase II
MIPIIISVVAMLVIVVIDQASKYLIVSHYGLIQQIYVENLDYEALEPIVGKLEPIEIIPFPEFLRGFDVFDGITSILDFRLLLNDGAAFGMLDNARWVFLVLSTVAIIAILVFLFWKKPQNKLLLVALTLVTGGGIANMIDRIWLGYVVDFIDFRGFGYLWMWVFNVADSCVTVGACVLALWMILDLIKEFKAEKAKKLIAAAENVAEATVIGENEIENESECENDGSDEG